MYFGISRSLCITPTISLCLVEINSKIHCIKAETLEKDKSKVLHFMGYPLTSFRFGGDLRTICKLKTPFLYYRAFQTNSCIPHFKGSTSKQTWSFLTHRPLQTFYDPNNMYLPAPPLKKGGQEGSGKEYCTTQTEKLKSRAVIFFQVLR